VRTPIRSSMPYGDQRNPRSEIPLSPEAETTLRACPD
jgi:hypothetical protein